MCELCVWVDNVRSTFAGQMASNENIALTCARCIGFIATPYMGLFNSIFVARLCTLKFTMMNKRETEPPYRRGTYRQIDRTINHLQPTG